MTSKEVREKKEQTTDLEKEKKIEKSQNRRERKKLGEDWMEQNKAFCVSRHCFVNLFR